MFHLQRIQGLAVAGILLAVSTACQRDGTSVAGTKSSQEDSLLSRIVSKPVVRSVPAGTPVTIELLDTVSSNQSQPGDRINARVAHDVVVDGAVAIPAGSAVTGVVTEAVGLKKIGGRAKLGLEFTSVEPPRGEPSTIRASYSALGKSETKKDTATIAGSAAGGAVLGRIIGHQRDNDARGTAVGGVVGAGVGTAIAAGTKGQEIQLSSGRVLELTLEAPAQVTVQG